MVILNNIIYNISEEVLEAAYNWLNKQPNLVLNAEGFPEVVIINAKEVAVGDESVSEIVEEWANSQWDLEAIRGIEALEEKYGGGLC